jgi:hypothetical protein
MILRFMGRMDSSPNPQQTIPPAKSRWRLWLFVALALIAALAIWYYPSLKAQAEVGSSYAARIGCSCRYVQGRDLDSCKTDFEPGMEIISVSDDPETQTVTGSVPLLASRSARFADASGCVFTAD